MFTCLLLFCLVIIYIHMQGSLTTFLTSEEETIFSPNFEDGDSQLANHGDGVKDGTSELPNLVTDEGDNGITGLTDYEACSLLDICFSDSVPSLPFHSCMGFPDVSFHHCELTNSDILIDVAEKYVLLPFPEKIMETSGIHSNESIEEIMLNSDDACFYIATHQEFDMNCQSGDLRETECFNPQLDFRFSHHIQAIPSGCPLLPEIETQERKPITLVLDLDETLVHSSLEHCDDVDFTFSVFFNMKKQTVYVKRRPFLQMFLERVAQMFEIVIFTASLSIYAAQLLDILDPEQRIISRRIYRESCIFSDGCYTKDLTILGVDLAKVVIIDNTPQVFHLQVNNGIPIKSWFDDPSDLALVQLLPFLESLVDADDVRPIIAKKFGSTTNKIFELLILSLLNQQQALQSMAALEEHASLQSANAMPEMDVITPIATVPVVNPTATTTTTPVYNPFPTMTPYSTPASSSSSGQSWCVASQTASQASLQVALDYACGYGGADCSSIQKGGGCFDPDTMRDHASYAFNDYYQRKPNPTSCDFAGTAIITSVDPSTSTCHYQSTSTSSSVLNTRYPYGSNVYGSSVPPTTSSSISISNGRSLLHISLIFITLSLNSFAEQGIQ
ncbi:hypothetical protein ZIOFF_029283 [Zingiber officinale]|uniref:FCP1 homology domain-containing protein n=1 Tax=Zingiber officinale TaxID=94328 RepID=A0A8J5LAH3_ZINOF|nr:hypothetical protein ZIOFF_029283 [Zingiber officinale]